jgi:hypothetical protein
MVGMVEQHFVQASPIEDFAAHCAIREVFLFFGWKLLAFVGVIVFLFTVSDWRHQTQSRVQHCQSNRECESRPYEVERGFPHSRLPDPSEEILVQRRVIRRRTNPTCEALLQ